MDRCSLMTQKEEEKKPSLLLQNVLPHHHTTEFQVEGVPELFWVQNQVSPKTPQI